jgi:hypothetical protein
LPIETFRSLVVHAGAPAESAETGDEAAGVEADVAPPDAATGVPDADVVAEELPVADEAAPDAAGEELDELHPAARTAATASIAPVKDARRVRAVSVMSVGVLSKWA